MVLRQGDPVGAGVEDGWVGIPVDIDGGCGSSLDVGVNGVVGDELQEVVVGQESIQCHWTCQENHTSDRVHIKERGGRVITCHLVPNLSL